MAALQYKYIYINGERPFLGAVIARAPKVHIELYYFEFKKE
jgi:hypothetical protein